MVFGTSAFGLGEKALLNYDTLDAENKGLVDQRVGGYTSPKELYINKIAEGVATVAASLYLKVINNALGVHHKEFYINMIAEGVATLAASACPKRIIVRLSDFKPSEYKSLIGGKHLEPDEESPMIGCQGCGCYIDPFLEECFSMELEAVKTVGIDSDCVPELRLHHFDVAVLLEVSEARTICISVEDFTATHVPS